MAKNRGMLDTVPVLWSSHWEVVGAVADASIVGAKTVTSLVKDASVEMYLVAGNVRNMVDDQLRDLGTDRASLEAAEDPISHLAEKLRADKDNEEIEVNGKMITRKELKELLAK